METPESLYEYFLKALAWVVLHHERKRLAADAGITVSALSQFLNSKKNAAVDTQRRLAQAAGFEYFQDFLEFGKALTSSSVSESEHPYGPALRVNELIHRDVIKRFYDKQLATTIYARLVELEKINPVALNQVLGYIDCKIKEEVEAVHKHDRRRQSDPEKIPITGDRRKLGG